MKRKAKTTVSRKTRAKPERVERASVDLARGEAYALLAVAGEAISMGAGPDDGIAKDFVGAVNKLRKAFRFKIGDED
jgi:hypothetical protein